MVSMCLKSNEMIPQQQDQQQPSAAAPPAQPDEPQGSDGIQADLVLQFELPAGSKKNPRAQTEAVQAAAALLRALKSRRTPLFFRGCSAGQNQKRCFQ